LKWPNDIYTKKTVKIGGVLCQSVFHSGKFHVTVGIGLNVDNDTPTTCLNTLIKEQVGEDVDANVTREQVLAAILAEYEELHNRFVSSTDGFDSFVQEYESFWLHTGQEVTLQDPDLSNGTGSSAGDSKPAESGKTTTAVIKGLAKTGGLLAQDLETHEMLELYPDGNSLDFFKGLIKRKLPK
jgi:biotin--protein ligase